MFTHHLYSSAHPYIFFNNDGVTITFVGFIITKNGDMTFPQAEPRIMTPRLYEGLVRQEVNFSDDYRRWSKVTMIQKLARVMGIDYLYDPDDTYVLTVDNLIKILAIQMRFRCGIPVVIMGETGCGKTRLIRYMCDLAREGREGRNMLILKVDFIPCTKFKLLIYYLIDRFMEVQKRVISLNSFLWLKIKPIKTRKRR